MYLNLVQLLSFNCHIKILNKYCILTDNHIAEVVPNHLSVYHY